MSVTKIGVKHPEATLVYFDARGEAEIIRFVMAVTGTSFKEIHAIEEFQLSHIAEDESILHKHLPMVKIDGHVLTKTDKIVKYLARRAYMLGAKLQEAKQVEMMYEKTREFYKPFLRQEALNEDKTQFVKHLKTCVLPEYLPKFNTILENNRGGAYLFGINACVADLGLLDVLFAILDYCDPDVLQPYYGIKMLLKTAREEKSLQYYVKQIRKPLQIAPGADALFKKHIKAVTKV